MPLRYNQPRRSGELTGMLILSTQKTRAKPIGSDLIPDSAMALRQCGLSYLKSKDSFHGGGITNRKRSNLSYPRERQCDQPQCFKLVQETYS